MKLPAMSKATRKVWVRRIKNFWMEYSHNRIGLLGGGLLLTFIIMALVSPFAPPYSVDQVRADSPSQTDNYAVPQWLPIISPQLQDLPPQTVHAMTWSIIDLESLPQSIDAQPISGGWNITYDANKTGSRDPVQVTLVSSLEYPYSPMRKFSLAFKWAAVPNETVKITRIIGGIPRVIGKVGAMQYMLELDITNPIGATYRIWDQHWHSVKFIDPRAAPEFWDKEFSQTVEFSSSEGPLARKLGYQAYETTRMTQDIFAEKGEYVLTIRLTFKAPETASGAIPIPIEKILGYFVIRNFKFTIWGRIWGLLGSDGFGHDVFSQIIHGAGISLMFGLSSAIIAVTFGILVGVTAGYLGGITDEALMRVVDILICLPVLPLLLVLIAMFGYNIWYLVLLVAVFGWQGLSRVIRSQVLSLREMAFVECAVASGGSKSYIMLRHIVPNVLPTALASLVLQVPGAIILEAALSFLGFGDPMAPTWGKMLQQAYEFGAFSPMNLAWWDIIPPGLCITLICLSFVFIGHAVDEIVNPRLRRRR